MKVKIYLFLIVLFSLNQITKAQTWEPLGPNDFDQISYGEARYTSIAFDGNVPYICFSDYNNYKPMVKRVNASGTGWEIVGSTDLTVGASYTHMAFNGGVPYVVYCDGNNNGKATVIKLSENGTEWEIVGTAGF